MGSLKLDRFAGFGFPEDPRSADAWDAFWSDLLDTVPARRQGVYGTSLPPGRRADEGSPERRYGYVRGYSSDGRFFRVVQLFRKLGIRSVMFPGCGLCLLPPAFTHSGFQVEAVDFSSVALEATVAHRASNLWWQNWLDSQVVFRPDSQVAPSSPRVVKVYEREDSVVEGMVTHARTPGGTLLYRKGDLFTMDCAPGTYDAIITRCLIEHYSQSDRETLLRSFDSWLRPGGVMVLQSEWFLRSRDAEESAALEKAVESAGFLRKGKATSEWVKSQPRGPIDDEQHRVRSDENERSDFEQARLGRKLAVLMIP